MSGTAADLLQFVNSSPTPFHLVSHAEQILRAARFTKLEERDSWIPGSEGETPKVVKGGRYFYNRNGSTLVAFTVGGRYQPGNGFKVIGAHTDSPVLKVRPNSQRSSTGYLQVGVECYGGGLWHTWFDRDLSLAGCVIVKEADGGFKKQLVHIKRPILRIPNLCIHLQTAEERSAFKFNNETHLQPILTFLETTLNKEESGKEAGKERHSPALLGLLAQELGCSVSAIKDFELTLFDTQPGTLWGLKNEFLSSPRLDNQAHCYTGLCALLGHAVDIEADSGVSMLVCFDHEEIGSDSAQGAGSPVMSEAVTRVLGCFSQGEEIHRITLRNSYLISADVAHAVHPNYPDKHEKNHAPALNAGTAIKTNNNQRYATNAETGFLLRELARRAGVPVQEYVVRNDTPCGSTIGPIIASKTGIRTVDLGICSWSMHSIRETLGCDDVVSNIKLFQTFYAEFAHLDSSCSF